MRRILCRASLAAIIIIAILFLAFPLPAIADGGPILSDPQLWAQLREGQQTAVVTLKDNDIADVDLFVSMLDDSGNSHQVVFFVPLGISPSNFNVEEETSLSFDEKLTRELDEALRREAEYKSDVRLSLLPGTLLVNGLWMVPLWFPLVLSSCSGARPEATYETKSSKVEIYGIDGDTDLEALISTTGLDPSVQTTLLRLKGQKIAVVKLKTQLPSRDSGNYYGPTGQPGIHLSWSTSMAHQSTEATYSYPLGTGTSWANPIELTRVYVVATPGKDFTVQYPKLGTDRSGFTETIFRPPTPSILGHYNKTAYAVDEATGDFGHIWRATYTQSNSSEDITIVIRPSGGLGNMVKQSIAGLGVMPIMIISIMLVLLLWVVAWRYTMTLLLGVEYRWGSSKLWREALVYPGINVAMVAVVAAVAFLFYLLASITGEVGFVVGIVLLALIVLIIIAPTLLGVTGALFFLKRHIDSLGVSRGRAVVAYIVVILITNIVYLALAAGYAALIDVI